MAVHGTHVQQIIDDARPAKTVAASSSDPSPLYLAHGEHDEFGFTGNRIVVRVRDRAVVAIQNQFELAWHPTDAATDAEADALDQLERFDGAREVLCHLELAALPPALRAFCYEVHRTAQEAAAQEAEPETLEDTLTPLAAADALTHAAGHGHGHPPTPTDAGP